MSKWNETERGNVALASDDGAAVLWILEDSKTAILEISYTPGNYPCWSVRTCRISAEKLAKHINERLVGWYVQKSNIAGIHMEGGEVVEKKDE